MSSPASVSGVASWTARVPLQLAAAWLFLAVAMPGVRGQESRAAGDSDRSLVTSCVAYLLEHQSGNDDEWPYEGVYRVGGQIPMGYRVGGTALVVRALLRTCPPGAIEEVDDAIARATRFILAGLDTPPMVHDHGPARYDVRGWGWACALHALVELDRDGRLPPDLARALGDARRFCITGIELSAIPDTGGWNYSRRDGFAAPGRPSPFMTATTLQALFEASAHGDAVDPGVIEAGLDALEQARTATGTYVYAGRAADRGQVAAPGALGRMLASETVLSLGGRGSPARLRGAVDAFLAHWHWLEGRRGGEGTHVQPYGIAPYYVYYAHAWAGATIERLPEPQRPEYRRRVRELLLSTRGEDGSFNDRVFERSACYGTAMALLTLTAADEAPARWGAD